MTKHIPRSENKKSILGGSLITSRIPAPKKETIKMQSIALMATISESGKRLLKSFINASFKGIIAIPKDNKNITTGVLCMWFLKFNWISFGKLDFYYNTKRLQINLNYFSISAK